MASLMGLDQHRAQVTTEWLDTLTGEVSRARVAPADRAGAHRRLCGSEVSGQSSAAPAARKGGPVRGGTPAVWRRRRRALS